MSNKNVEFLEIVLKNKNTGVLLDCCELRRIFNDILVKHGVKNIDCITLDLTPRVSPDSYNPKILLDVYEMSDIMFARVSKKKENNAIQRRDYTTYIADDVFTAAEMSKLGIEVFTYFIIDFKKGIISIVNAQDAPGPRILNWVFEEYDKTYEIEFSNIPNKDGIDILYKSESSKITRYEFDIPTPNAEYLQEILGLSEEEIVKIVNHNAHKATLIIRPEPYKNMESNHNVVREIIDILKRKQATYDKSVIRAKTDEFNNRDYDLHAKYFTYPITVKKFRTVGGEKVGYNNDEMKNQFKEGLMGAYNKNKDLILAIVDRENGD